MKLALPFALSLALLAPFPASAANETNASSEARIRELEAEIARRHQDYQQRQLVRRKQIAGTVKEPRFEKYLVGFRRKIACSSVLHYPEAARGKIYGEMIVTISILADGSFEKARVDRSSGHKALDDSVIDIARQAAPFEPFPSEIRRDTDALDITRAWTFTTTEETAAGADDPCA
ncbi:MAG: energy transducer TonB [Proteobacteria bacterium]|jgi:protein TonB|nr:energy transducer TonB [Pseudomonadota bacterium]